jgi:copper chaperone CopZ
MKKIIFMVAVFVSVAATAQVTHVTIQASGLTCSMCSNAINKAIKSLDFVDKVEANIKKSSFDISFKPNAVIDFDKLKMKVEDAGFFVAVFTANINFDNVTVQNDTHVEAGSNTFHFLNIKGQTLNGNKAIRILDKGFIPAKEYKKNSNLTKMECYKTGEENGKRVFHVTI